MNSVIDLRTYVGASHSRLLVMVDLQQGVRAELAMDHSCSLSNALDNCLAAIRHARTSGIPIAFTRRTEGLGWVERSAQSAWIPGFEPKRSDMVFERQQPSCYGHHLFGDVVSRVGSFAICGLAAEEVCLATAIDASSRGHRVTYLSDASASRARQHAEARAVHAAAAKAIELFADVAATSHWLVATSQRPLRGHRYG
jgi:nicotinamidase-related amidase